MTATCQRTPTRALAHRTARVYRTRASASSSSQNESIPKEIYDAERKTATYRPARKTLYAAAVAGAGIQLAAQVLKGIAGVDTVADLPLPEASLITIVLDGAFATAAVAAWRTEETMAEERVQEIWKEVQLRAKKRVKGGPTKRAQNARKTAKGFGATIAADDARQEAPEAPAALASEADDVSAEEQEEQEEQEQGGLLGGARALFDEANANAKAQALVLSAALDEWEEEQKQKQKKK
ncbi:hypothetical protein PPROV_000680800 [Pycnococcus provasolii]|uniref:Uncharacterized protein n=1 Tax=Pycnococcus provasolii TaxID=41880 RepID=A0A830HKZ8_9CHLO|nr:hypothetical protein PPROV_000680800 [Pycnococcus provasolii]